MSVYLLSDKTASVFDLKQTLTVSCFDKLMQHVVFEVVKLFYCTLLYMRVIKKKQNNLYRDIYLKDKKKKHFAVLNRSAQPGLAQK